MKLQGKNQEDKKIYKLKKDDKYLSYHILKAILQETNVPIKVIEEKNSELFYETLTGKGKVIFSNSLKYYGPVKNGLLETGIQDPEKEEKDLCIIVFPDGTKYEGEIHSNKISGEGKYYFPSGAKYTGNVLNGLRDGYGKYYSPEGVTYEGEWKCGLKNGKGKMKSDSMTYDGDWEMGNIHGKGKIKWDNGNVFEGQFKENHMDGFGYMIWFDIFEKYFGNWKNDKQNGNGVHIWYEPSGELKEMRNRYVGEWNNGARNGYGVFFYSNGARYEGEWKNNLKNGFGIMLYEDGKKYIGRFEEDRLVDKFNELSEEMTIKLYEEYIMNKNKKEKNKDKENNSNNVTTDNKKKPIKSRRTSLLSINSINNNIQEIKEKENNKELTNKNTANLASGANTQKEKENDINLNSLLNKQNNAKKLIFKFVPIFNLEDLEIDYPEIKSDNEEITKVLLRNLAGINKLYNYINKIGKMEILNEETGKPNMILTNEQLKALEHNFVKKNSKNLSLSRASFKVQNKKLLSKKSLGPSLIQLNMNLMPKIEDQLRSDDINFCIQLKDFWYYARECGLFNDNKITLAEFNRSFNSGKNNFYESFQIPIHLIESDNIYKYMNDKINQAKKNFLLKYKNYFNYYYREKDNERNNILNEIKNIEIKDENNLINSVHDERRIILPRFFYECIIRLSFLIFSHSSNYAERNMNLSKKLDKILDIFIPSRMRKKQSSNMKLSMNKMEQSFNNSMNVIEGNMTKITEMRTINEFVTLYIKELKYIFDKIYNLYKEKNFINFNKLGDMTITHLFLYREIFSKSNFFRQIIPNVITYIEIIFSFSSSKLNFVEYLTKLKKSDYFDNINEILLKEITEWEFYEIIFLISKKQVLKNNKKLVRSDLKNFLDKIKENIDIIIRSKLLKKKYFYPKLKSHIIKEELIEEEKRRKEEERRIKLERERYYNERNNFQKEDVNVFVENYEEEDEDYEDTDEFLN